MQRRTFLQGLGAIALAGLATPGCGDVSSGSQRTTPTAPQNLSPSQSQLAAGRFVFLSDGSRLELYPFQNLVRLLAADGSVLFEQAGLGVGANQWNFPNDASPGPDGLLLVSDSGNSRVKILDRTGLLVGVLPIGGFPGGVASSGTNIFVSNQTANQILTFTWQGGGALAGNAFGSPGDGDGQLNAPSGMAFDPQSQLHVCDSGNHRVQVFTQSGAFVRSYRGGLTLPEKLVIDPKGLSYVADPVDAEVQVFDAGGGSLPSFPIPAGIQPIFVSLSPDLVLWVTNAIS